tara:strand:+ start:4577 stop:5395 length:819 start_codon:yes stop_codon:yes gene_type:complete
MYPLIKIFIRFFSSEPNIKNWIIILSNYNSGSTLLKNILSNAQEIAFLPDESVLYSTQVKRPDEEFGWQRNWIFCEDKIGSKNLGRSNFIKFIYDISPVWVKSSKTIFFMDKTISNITRIQWFINNCENIKFLAITRNPYACCEGMSRKSRPVDKAKEIYGKNKYSFSDLAKQYKLANEEILKFSNKLKYFKLIKYEDLCMSPSKVMLDVFDFLEISSNQIKFEKNLIEVNKAKFKIINYNSSSINRLKKSEITEINNVLGSLINKLEYEKI